MDTLQQLISEVNTLKTVTQYCYWLTRLNDKDFVVWKNYPTAQYYAQGAIEDEQKRRQTLYILYNYPTKLAQGYEVNWIWATRQHGTYPIDTEANGKWMIFAHITEIDRVWFVIAEAVEQGKLGSSAKVSIKSNFMNGSNPDERVICIYTYDSEDKKDLLRILQELRNIGIHHKALYKEDSETHAGNYAGMNIISGQTTNRSPIKYYARPKQVELLIPKSRQ